MLVHLTLHWDWVVRTTRKLFRLRGHDRVIWLVNLALLVGMTLCVVSGIVISRVALPSLGFFLTSNLFWNRLHILTAEITLGLVPVHAALRWRWIAGAGAPPAGPAHRRPGAGLAVKFVRQLGAVLLVVAAVTALGVAWEHSSAGRPDHPVRHLQDRYEAAGPRPRGRGRPASSGRRPARILRPELCRIISPTCTPTLCNSTCPTLAT